MNQKLKYSWRVLKQNKLFLTINIIGISVGLTACLLLSIYIQHEISYDKHFNKADRIVRLITTVTENDIVTAYPISLRIAHTEIPEIMPQIESSVQLYHGPGKIRINKKQFFNIKTVRADSSYFSIFDHTIIEKSGVDPFSGPNSVVITESMARKIFGDRSAIGEQITADDTEVYTVSAVVKDPPKTTHIVWDMIFPLESLSWIKGASGMEFYTYYLLKEGDIKSTCSLLEKNSIKYIRSKFGDEYVEYLKLSISLEPLTEIHLGGKASYNMQQQGEIKHVILVSIIALITLIIALFNSINLFIIFGRSRLKEIGIKKVVGADTSQIKREILSEAFAINLIAVAIGVFTVYALLPYFSDLMQRSIAISTILTPISLSVIIFITLFGTISAGIYPATVLSKFSILNIVKGSIHSGRNRNSLTSLIVIFQFIVVITLLIGTISINNQIERLKNSDMGFDLTNRVNINGVGEEVYKHRKLLEREILAIPEVESVIFSNYGILGSSGSGEDIERYGSSEKHPINTNSFRVFPGFCKFFDIDLKWGRYLVDKDFENRGVIVINNTLANKLNITKDGDRQVVFNNKTLEVVGVTEDFNFESSLNSPLPLTITPNARRISSISIKLNGTLNQDLRDKVVGIIQKVDSDYIPIIRNHHDLFYNDLKPIDRLKKIVTIGTLLALMICMMGLFAVTTFDMQNRKKEYGIRKVIGATSIDIITITAKKIIIWFTIASAVALPLATCFVREILSNFSNEISIGVSTYIYAVIIPLIISSLTIGYNVYKVVTGNPVDSLKDE